MVNSKIEVKMLDEDSQSIEEGDSILKVEKDQGGSNKKINKIKARENKQMKCLSHQVKVMAFFYLIFVICNIVVQTVGNALMKNGDEFKCNNNNSIQPLINPAAIFLFV